MPRFPSLPEEPHLADVLQRFPRGAWRLMQYSDDLLRGESELSVGEREMLAAYVSGLNGCAFCHGSHRIIAEIHGVDAALLEALLASPEESGIEAKWQPLLAYLRKLTLSPARIVDSDARAVLEAGFSEEALFDAISVCALFNFMNRIVEGCGVRASETNIAASRERHQVMKDAADPYRRFGRLIGLGATAAD